ncbi:MAG TPA: hypothetical protein VKB88_22050 [Bryobacteraceae bacterium]|nr:hypothetical protein [Bryobacteraceae bacterium]
MTGVSQPRIHNVLAGKKLFSGEVSDAILRELDLDLLDFLYPADFAAPSQTAAATATRLR